MNRFIEPAAPRGQEGIPMEKVKEGLSAKDIAVRERLISQMRRLPDEAYSRTQYMQFGIGCNHGCGFCSQGAGGTITQETRGDIQNFFSAIGVVSAEVAARSEEPERARQYGLIGYGRGEHKPGVIFPYFDNDPTLYDNFDEIVSGFVGLGNKIRISTAGYPRRSQALQKANEIVANQYTDAFDGLRFSFTHYPKGWFHPEEYKLDLANTFRTYRPVVEQLGYGKDEAAVELRYAPHVETEKKPLDDTFIQGRHVIHTGQYLLIGPEGEETDLFVSKVAGIDGRTAVTTSEGRPYTLYVSDRQFRYGDWKQTAEEIIAYAPEVASETLEPLSMFKETVLARKGMLHLFENADGPYYSLDPSFTSDGMFRALQIYPQTETRQVSGYLDTTRYFLNTLLSYKYRNGIGRREDHPNPSWAAVDEVIHDLTKLQVKLAPYDARASLYVELEVFQLIQKYRDVLELADYGPDMFFNRFTVDTGTIVNQGRARACFKGLAVRNDMPLTPQEERGYGDDVSVAAARGDIWRWSPMPYFDDKPGGRRLTGIKNIPGPKGSIMISKLDYHNLTPFRPDGTALESFIIGGFDFERVFSPQTSAHLFQVEPITIPNVTQ